MKHILPDVFLTFLMELDPPTILHCIVHILKMIFAIFSISFWHSWPKICCCKSQKMAILVTVAARYDPLCRQKASKCRKKFLPWNRHFSGLVMGKKNLHFVHSGQSYGGSKSKVSKNDAKVPYLNADLGVGSCFGPLCGQKRSKSKIVFPPEPRLRWLD